MRAHTYTRRGLVATTGVGHELTLFAQFRSSRHLANKRSLPFDCARYGRALSQQSKWGCWSVRLTLPVNDTRIRVPARLESAFELSLELERSQIRRLAGSGSVWTHPRAERSGCGQKSPAIPIARPLSALGLAIMEPRKVLSN